MPLQVDDCKFCQKASYKYTNMALKRRKHFKRCSFVDCRAESGEK